MLIIKWIEKNEHLDLSFGKSATTVSHAMPQNYALVCTSCFASYFINQFPWNCKHLPSIFSTSIDFSFVSFGRCRGRFSRVSRFGIRRSDNRIRSQTPWSNARLWICNEAQAVTIRVDGFDASLLHIHQCIIRFILLRLSSVCCAHRCHFDRWFRRLTRAHTTIIGFQWNATVARVEEQWSENWRLDFY